MKKITAVLFVLLMVATILNAQDYKRYQYKSGEIHYKVSGMMNGTEDVYFTDYGMKEAKIDKTTMEMMGIKQNQNQKTILDGNTTYAIDYDKRTVTKMETPMLSMFPKGTDLTKGGEEMMTNMGGKKVGTGTILGKNCDIWEIQNLGSKIWIWNSIPMKTETNLMGMKISQEATDVKVDVSVSDEHFDIPKDFKVQTMNQQGNPMNFMK